MVQLVFFKHKQTLVLYAIQKFRRIKSMEHYIVFYFFPSKLIPGWREAPVVGLPKIKV